MAGSDQLLQRNKDLEATCAHEVASIIARHQVYVITFLDPRTDSSAFLELDLGDATGGAAESIDHEPPRQPGGL